MILKFDDLVNISNALWQAGYGEERFNILIPVENKEILDKLNEDFHYRFNQDGEINFDVDDINIKIGRHSFTYYVDSEKKEEEA